MSSGEFEQLITRNANFLSVRRAGSGNGFAGLHCAITGKLVLGIGGGTLPEHSFMKKPKWACECYHPNAPKGFCKTGAHGTELVRGWRNVLFELVARGRVKASEQILNVLGTEDAQNAVEKLFERAPMNNPSPSWVYSGLSQG